ncbi:MAG TPA: PIG-L family deacetylase [Kofleriaceae bacterium]
MKAIPAVALLVMACGDNATPKIAPSDNLLIVAHQDDDLLFMQRDLFKLVAERQPVTTVYVTAGDAGNGIVFSGSRNRALQTAYSAVAGSKAWTCEQIELAGHRAQKCSLDDRPVTLVFLSYPDGGVVGELPASLLHLWEGSIDTAATIAAEPTLYDRPGLIATVAAIIKEVRPQIVRTLEVSGTHGDDHSDHMIVGALTQLALAEAGSDAQLLSYRGYNINYEPANVTEADYAQGSLFMRMYLACLNVCGVCGETPCETVDDPRYYGFLHRRYVVSMRDGPLTGVLSSGAGCVGTDGQVVSVESCSAAPDIQIEDAGLIRVGDACLEVERTGELGLGACEPDANRFFQLDQEGHLFSGVPPEQAPDMLYDHSSCVFTSRGGLSVGTCGEHREMRWQVIP